MGQFHFDVPEPLSDLFEMTRWQNAYICGIEGIPWQCQTRWQNGRLTVTRSIDASGKLHLVCPVGDLGYRSLSTCSLRCAEPKTEETGHAESSYNLFLELARGSCFRVQSQADIWQRAGLNLEPSFQTKVDSGVRQFLDAVETKRTAPDKASQAAIQAIETLEQASDMLGDSYTHQSLAYRKKQEPQIGTLLAGTLIPPSPTTMTAGDQFPGFFNAAAVRVSWAEIENDAGRYDFDEAKKSIAWCNERGLRVIAGPLVEFRERVMPHWLYLLDDNFEALVSSVIGYVERTVLELRGTIHLWNCASGLNTAGPFKLNDEQAMRLAVGILQTIRRLDPNTPAIMSFDQPFGEYLAKNRDGISPLHFADALARSGLGLAGLGLDLRLHYQNSATDPRSTVDFGLMMDRWATLGLPLLATIGVPGGTGTDERAVAPEDAFFDSSSPLTADQAAQQQAKIAGPLLRTLLAKHVVHGIVWDGWNDAEPHISSHSGVLDSQGKPRPICDLLKRLRSDYLA